MYLRIFAIIALLSFSPAHALEYIHNDGTPISVSIPKSLSLATQSTIKSEIQQMFPQKTTSKILEINQLDIDSLNLDEMLDTFNWEHTINIKKLYSDSSITSVLITTYEYTGGAHGSMSRIGLVMDTKTGKKLSLADFYDADKLAKKLSPIWDKQIAIRLKNTMRENLTADEKSWIHDGTTDIQQYQSFTITPRILTIYGQQYQHNAYAYGMQTLIYPRFRLKDIAR